jgi:hypothetical protein
VDTLRKVTNALPDSSFFIVCGDFNIYSANEAAYSALLQVNTSSNGEFNDVLNLSGTWNNSSYADHHTQSPRDIAFNGGASGGMDDRFDMILFSDGINNSGGITYKSNTYNAYGNDGNHYNGAINGSPTNTAVGQTIADALYYASDHIPVEAVFEYNANGGGTPPINTVDTIVLAEYDRANVNGCVSGASFTATDVTVKSICRSNGVTYNSTGGDYNTRNWPQTNTIDLNAFLEFSVTPSSEKSVIISSIRTRLDRSSTGPSEVRIRTSLDNYSSDVFTVSNLSTSGAEFSQNLNLNASDTLTFRIYAYNASSAAGTFDIEGFTGNHIVDPGIQLEGFVVSNFVWNGSNWNTGAAPSGNLFGGDVTIQQGGSAANLTANVTAKTVTIESGAALEISNGFALTVEDTIYVKDGSNGFSQVKGTVNGNAVWQHRNTGLNAGWYYISFPVNGTIGDIRSNEMTIYTASNGQVNQQNIYYYNADTINPANNEGVWVTAESLSKSLKGTAYTIFQGPPLFGNFPITLTATGNLNHGNQTFDLKSRSAAPINNRGWNLIANPYPCSLNWEAVKAQNNVLDATFYINNNNIWYSHNGSVGDANNYIPPGQSFFVKASNTSSITLTESMTTIGQRPARFKQNVDHLELTVSSSKTTANSTWIGFNNTLTFGLDKEFDGLKKYNTDSTSANLYSLDPNGNPYVFNGLPKGLNAYQIPLEFNAVESGSFALDMIENLPSGFSYALYDHSTGDTNTYLPGTPYSFNYVGNSILQRFTLLINPSNISIASPFAADWMQLEKTDMGWELTSLSGEILDFQVTDLSGKQIQKSSTSTRSILELKNGIYLIRVYNSNTGDWVSKKLAVI